MSHLTLEQHNAPTLQSPSWADVESALLGVHPRDRGFFILSRPGSGYVQAAGARLRMVCEWREITGPDTFRHFVLGHPGRDERRASINTCVGIVQLQQNEILTPGDVIVAFRRYYDDGTAPEQFVPTGGPSRRVPPRRVARSAAAPPLSTPAVVRIICRHGAGFRVRLLRRGSPVSRRPV